MTEQTTQREPGKQYRRPLVDVFETDKDVVLQFELPGVAHDDIGVDVEGDTLKVETKGAGGEEAGRTLLSEFSPGDFYREFLLSRELDRNSIAASWSDGVLTLRIPKAAGKSHKIEIESAE